MYKHFQKGVFMPHKNYCQQCQSEVKNPKGHSKGHNVISDVAKVDAEKTAAAREAAKGKVEDKEDC